MQQFISKNGKKYRLSDKKIVQIKGETEANFLIRIEKQSLLFRVVNNKENYTIVKDFDEKGNKRILFYIEVL